MTTRGFDEVAIEKVGVLISEVLHNLENEEVLADVKARVATLTNEYPLYQVYKISDPVFSIK